MTDSARTTVLQAGRQKAYRPLPIEERRAAFAAGMDAYDRGDHFLAHDLLEPAWMGTDDVIERDAIQGLIKIAAAFVHARRGNPLGIAKNLRGARERLSASLTHPAELQASLAALRADLDADDIGRIVGEIDTRLTDLAVAPDNPAILPIPIRRSRPS